MISLKNIIYISLLLFLQIDSPLKKKKNLVFLNKKEFLGIKERRLEKKRKKSFLKIIDNTLIDDKSFERLCKFIQRRFEIFL